MHTHTRIHSRLTILAQHSTAQHSTEHGAMSSSSSGSGSIAVGATVVVGSTGKKGVVRFAGETKVSEGVRE